MYSKELEHFSNASLEKYRMARDTPFRYLFASIIAGFFILVAVILSNVVAAVFYKTSPETAKLLGAVTFSIAIVLIVFVGGELFTGNNMTMAFGLYSKKIKFGNACRVWLMSYIGNFIGAFLLGVIFVASGCVSDILKDYYTAIIPGKLGADPFTLFIRGVLCNFLVCLSVFVGKKMKSEAGKLVVMFCVITTFVISGFEHCVANMGIFTVAGFLLGGLPIQEVVTSFVFVTLGNIVGGAVLFALPIKLASDLKK